MPDLNPFDHPLFLGFLVALGAGLLIGIDRERSKGEGPGRAPAGIRTFTLAALGGAVAMALGGEMLLAVVVLAVGGLLAVAYWRDRGEDPGLTTETALILSALLGGLAMREPAFAAALAVVVTALLTARADIHRFVRSSLSTAEVRDGLIFAGATLVVLPLLPDHPVGPWQALNLRTIWIVVILVMAVGAIGYALVRVLGNRYGLPLAGLASGFVSSTATIAAMGARAAKTPEALRPAAAAAVLSTVATVVQMALLLAATDMAVLQVLYVPLIAAGVAAIAYGGGVTLWALREKNNESPEPGRAFSLTLALSYAAMLAAILVVSAGLQQWLGGAGAVVAVAAAGLADAHAAAVSAASLVAGGRMTPAEAMLPILAAFTSNTVSKIFFAVVNGGRAFAMLVVPGLLLVAVAAWAGAFAVGFGA